MARHGKSARTEALRGPKSKSATSPKQSPPTCSRKRWSASPQRFSTATRASYSTEAREPARAHRTAQEMLGVAEPLQHRDAPLFEQEGRRAALALAEEVVAGRDLDRL